MGGGREGWQGGGGMGWRQGGGGWEGGMAGREGWGKRVRREGRMRWGGGRVFGSNELSEWPMAQPPQRAVQGRGDGRSPRVGDIFAEDKNVLYPLSF